MQRLDKVRNTAESVLFQISQEETAFYIVVQAEIDRQSVCCDIIFPNNRFAGIYGSFQLGQVILYFLCLVVIFGIIEDDVEKTELFALLVFQHNALYP